MLHTRVKHGPIANQSTVQGPKIWNSLPTVIKAATSFLSFKRLIKTFLRDKQNNSIHT